MLLSAFIRAARSNSPTTTMTSLAAASSRSATFASSACAAAAARRSSGASANARGLILPSPAPMLSMPMLPSSRTLTATSSPSSSTRGFFAAAASASPSQSSSSLLSVLDTEIKYEAEHAPQGPPDLPSGWAFEHGGSGAEANGSARLTLRSTNAPAGEKVSIDLLVDDQDDDEDDEAFGEDDDEEGDGEEGEGDPFGSAGVVFTISVEKEAASPGSALLFDCRSDGTYLQIMHVSLEKTKKGENKNESDDDDDDDDDAEFSGPHFDELDEALQAEFEAFLEARGVTPGLGGALAALAEDKEAREYAAWLARVRDFVAAR